jgi:hypothetical protein
LSEIGGTDVQRPVFHGAVDGAQLAWNFRAFHSAASARLPARMSRDLGRLVARGERAADEHAVR